MNEKDYWSKATLAKFQLEEKKTAKQRKQEKCPHLKYSIICALCGKTLGSELGFTDATHQHEETII
jgi:hypothetical protein